MLWTVPAIAKESGKSVRHVKRVLGELGFQPAWAGPRPGNQYQFRIGDDDIGRVLARLINGRPRKLNRRPLLPGEIASIRPSDVRTYRLLLPGHGLRLVRRIESEPHRLIRGDTARREELIHDGRCIACIEARASVGVYCHRCNAALMTIESDQRYFTVKELRGWLSPELLSAA